MAFVVGVLACLFGPDASDAKPCRAPAYPARVVSKLLVDLGDLVDVESHAGKCS